MSNGSNGGNCAQDLASGVHCLTRQQKDGLVVVALSGFISLIAVLFIIARIVRNVIYSRRLAAADAGRPAIENGYELAAAGGEGRGRRLAAADTGRPAIENGYALAAAEGEDREAPPAEPRRRLIELPMDLFMLSLFFASLLQALGVILEVKWINDGAVRTGRFCTAQGVLLSLGQSGLAMQTTIITIHTFHTIWRRGGVERLRTAWILVGTMWVFLGVFFIASSASANNTTPPFYFPTPWWCGIHGHHSKYRIAGESFWLWLAFAAASLEEASSQRTRLPTFTLMICALAYCIPVLPTALARWFLLVHNGTKPFASREAQASIKTILGLSGLFDVVVFLIARQNLLLFRQSRGARRPSSFQISARVRIGACVAVWMALNAAHIVWIYFYILSATDPVPRRKSNENPAGWKGYYVMMYLYGFTLGLVNVGVLGYIAARFKQDPRRLRFASLQTGISLKILKYFLCLLIVALSVFMIVGPLFAPLIGVKLAQRVAWDRRCVSPVEVILEGRPFYNAINANPSFASFYFGPPGRRTEYYKYGMTQDANDTTLWHLRLINGSFLPDLDPVYRPMAQELTYRFANHSFAATCTTNTSSSAVIPCMEGSFNDDGNILNLNINDLRTGNVTKLRAVDKGVWQNTSPADDAPSMLIREVRADDSLGAEVLRTAVTRQTNCTELKLCVSKMSGIDLLLAPVGLILKAQDNYATTCTTPNSN